MRIFGVKCAKIIKVSALRPEPMGSLQRASKTPSLIWGGAWCPPGEGEGRKGERGKEERREKWIVQFYSFLRKNPAVSAHCTLAALFRPNVSCSFPIRPVL